MTQKEKLVEKFFENPASLRYSQVQVVLEHFGFEQIQAKGSHVKFKHPKISSDLVIPVHNNECKDFYKQLAKKYIQNLI